MYIHIKTDRLNIKIYIKISVILISIRALMIILFVTDNFTAGAIEHFIAGIAERGVRV